MYMLLPKVCASPGNGSRVWENCLAQPQGGEMYLESFQDLWLDIKKLWDPTRRWSGCNHRLPTRKLITDFLKGIICDSLVVIKLVFKTDWSMPDCYYMRLPCLRSGWWESFCVAGVIEGNKDGWWIWDFILFCSWCETGRIKSGESRISLCNLANLQTLWSMVVQFIVCGGPVDD